MIHASDILRGVKAFWDADTQLDALVPGGLTMGRVVQGAAVPYATVKVKAQEPEYNSGRQFIQAWDVSIVVWSTEGATDAGVIQSVLDGVYNRDRGEQLPVPGATKVLDLRHRMADADEDPVRREAEDVVMATVDFQVLVQAGR